MESALAPLKIVYHHRTRSRDGQSIHIDEIIRALRELGHSVEVVEPRRIDATAEGIESKLLPAALYELFELGYSFLEFIKLARAVLRKRPDFIYERANLYTLSGLWVSRLFGLPLLLEVNAPLAEERALHGRLRWKRLAAFTERAVWRGASVVMPVTEALAAYLYRAGVPQEKVVVTPNGVDVEKFGALPSSRVRAALSLDGKLVLGFVGYMRPWHGLEEILQALASSNKLRNTKLVIVGDGPARAAIESQISELQLADRVTLTGVVAHDELPAYMACFDIALQPKVTPYASPLKLFEYMAQGCAIIAPSAPNIREILEHRRDGLLFDQNDPRQLILAIEELVEDSALREKLGAGAKSKIIERDLTWRGNAKRIAVLGASFSSQPLGRPLPQLP